MPTWVLLLLLKIMKAFPTYFSSWDTSAAPCTILSRKRVIRLPFYSHQNLFTRVTHKCHYLNMKYSMMWLRGYWSNSSKKNSKVSKRKLTSLNPPFLRCLDLYTDAYMPRGTLGGCTQSWAHLVLCRGVGLVLLLWFLHYLIQCKYSGSPPGGISRIPYVWDVCMKVLFHLEKRKLIFKMSIIYIPHGLSRHLTPHLFPLRVAHTRAFG